MEEISLLLHRFPAAGRPSGLGIWPSGPLMVLAEIPQSYSKQKHKSLWREAIHTFLYIEYFEENGWRRSCARYASR